MLLHTLVPHEHHDEMDAGSHATEHEETDTLLGWIKTIFHHDVGENHLENFDSPEDGLDLDLQINIASAILILTTSDSAQDNPCDQIDNSLIEAPPPKRFLTVKGLRGPPYIS